LPQLVRPRSPDEKQVFFTGLLGLQVEGHFEGVLMTTEKPYGRMMFEALIDCGSDDDSALAEDGLTINNSGVYLKRQGKYERQGLMPGDLAFLEKHPTGRYDDPALRFPFGPAELLEFECIYTVITDRWRYGDGERRTDGLTGEAIWLVAALLDVEEGKRTANEVNDEARLKFAPEVAADAPRSPLILTPARKNEKNYKRCEELGLVMPTELNSNGTVNMPRGLSKAAKDIGMSRQALTESVTNHIAQLEKKK